jgi:hypothetical protein
MAFLIVSAAVTFLTGVFLFFAGESVKKVSDFLNRTIFHLDEALCSARLASGLILLLLGGWIAYTGAAYPDFWYLKLAGWIIVVFGLLYLFFPSWLGAISEVADRIMLSTDELVLNIRKVSGVVLVLISFYIFYSVFQIK